ncbi:hypothetical protein XENTR_v10000178 [Xenopus tropicalis]|uniref:Uncharacterized protein ig100492381 n=1 Tax=Xenopus tropicalis TaxID=8364 RepID=A0A8J0QR58_XENTR|nr:uncharacterized protein ig100492381 [Xenopus tropicalis]KAE8628695.1 hypothetical protein XENTR_v10000178 [Xenopus tropicalis]|eukprot:XP_002936341.1 PREDICTED: uncharacterized protein LOC100492381 [Xenopus tropicalis]
MLGTASALLLLPLFILSGSYEAFNISASRSHVRGTQNSSLLLSISYNILPETSWIQIKWDLLDPKTELVRCTIRGPNSSSEEENLSIKTFPPGGFEGRMHIIPENGSLVIHRLAQSDSGIYQVTLRDSKSSASATINVTVEDAKKAITSVWEHVPATPNNTETEMKTQTAPYCFCTSNSSSVSLPTSAGIVLGSRIFTMLITLTIFFCLGMETKPPRRNMIRKYYGPTWIQ